MITAPGLYTDAATRAAYHSDPCQEISLSRSVAKAIAARTPAHAFVMHPRLNPNYEPYEASKFDIGSAAHTMILKEGSAIEIIDADDWRTKAAKDARDFARAAGKTPMLRHQYVETAACVAKVREQLPAFGLGDILDPEKGQSEVVAAWNDPVAGWCRVMFDRLMGDLTVWDFKFTGIELTDENLSRHMAGMGYEFQHAFYERGLCELFPDIRGRVNFGFVFCENKPPFAILPVRLSNAAVAKGRAAVAVACERWRDAKASGNWPAYDGDVRVIDYPPWAIAEWMGDTEEGETE